MTRSAIRAIRYDDILTCELCNIQIPYDGRTKLKMKLHMWTSHGVEYRKKNTFKTQNIQLPSGKVMETDLFLNKSLYKCPVKKVVTDTKKP